MTYPSSSRILILLTALITTLTIASTPSVAQKTQIEQLRSGDRLEYQGVQWQVQDYGTYKDPQGYQTQEWQLSSKNCQKCYLQREYNPIESAEPIHWYFAEEISNPQVLKPGESANLIPSVWQKMQDAKTPEGELQALNRSYLFDFQTEGTYSDHDGSLPRITWDYWDKAHRWNLELEAFPDKELHVYSSQEVKPEAFHTLPPAKNSQKFPLGQAILATSMIFCGIVMMHYGSR